MTSFIQILSLGGFNSAALGSSTRARDPKPRQVIADLCCPSRARMPLDDQYHRGCVLASILHVFRLTCRSVFQVYWQEKGRTHDTPSAERLPQPDARRVPAARQPLPDVSYLQPRPAW